MLWTAFIMEFLSSGKLPPETENSNQLGFAEIFCDQIVDDQLIVNTFRGIMHATKSTIDRENDREPQGVEYLIDDPCQGRDYKSVIHSGTSKCYVKYPEDVFLPSYFVDIIYTLYG